MEWCGLEKENEILLEDLEFKKVMRERIDSICYQDMIEYNCSGEDEKELHEYKVKSNELKVLCENMKKGLNEIYATFAREEKQAEEPKDYYEFLCSLARSSVE